MRFRDGILALTLSAAVVACDDGMGIDDQPMPKDPDTATKVAVDRFSDAAGTLFVRSANPDLPGANEPIDLDQGPFITQGLGPNGQVVRYYNFDVMPTESAPIFVLFREGEDAPVEGQLNVIDVIPGDAGYNDFWHVVKVTVPEDYVANTVASLAEIEDAGYAMEHTGTIVNCPVVPEGSTASEGGGAAGLTRGWYQGEVVFYLNFVEAPLSGTGMPPAVPTSPIFVTFNINPDQPGGGPASGFVTESGTDQTHNVVATIPGDDGYSPLWEVFVYDNADFDQVSDLASAQAANIFGVAAIVNCPVVFVGMI